MARLPSREDFGGRPDLSPRRGYAGGGQGYTTPDVSRGARALSSAGEDIGAAIFKGGAVLADKAEKDRLTQDKYDLAAAESAFLRKKVELDNAFDNDPDYATYGKRYEAGIKQASADASALIKNPDNRKLFDLKAGDLAAQGLAKIGDKAQAKEKDFGRGYLIDTIDSTERSLLEAKDPSTREALVNSLTSSIVSAREKGHISYEEEAKLRQKTAESVAERWVKSQPIDTQLRILSPVKSPTASAPPADPNDDYYSKLAQVESGGNPKAVNPKSGASGLYQFTPGTAKQYGVSDPTDPQAARAGVERLRADNKDVLTVALGREPTQGEEYLAHQQGASGAAALLKNPDKPAIEVLSGVYKNRATAARAIIDNGGSPEMTAGEFSAKQQARFSTARPQKEFQVAQNDQVYTFPRSTGSMVDFLPADKRMQLMDQAVRSAAILEDRDQRLANQRLKEAGDQAEKDLADIHQAGTLDVGAVQSRRSVLSADSYKAWLKIADPKAEEIKDNREAVARLEPIMDTPEAGAEIDREFNLGNLSTATYRSMREKARTLQKDDQPDSPFKTGRSFLSDALDPGQLGGEATIQQPLRIARQRALAEYDTWAEANPKLTRAQTMAKAEELLGQWQTVGFGQMRIALPRPRGFAGNKKDVEMKDVNLARQKVIDMLDSGQITKQQADPELSTLDTWEQVIEKGQRK